MKFLGSSIAILNNTNRVIGSLDSDWSTIRSGDLIQIGSSPIFYTIQSIREYEFSSDFEVISSNAIILKDNKSLNLLALDNIKLYYHEYELFTIFKILNKGVGYSIGDIVTIRGGCPKKDYQKDQLNQTQLKITDVGPNGEVNFLTIHNKGQYISSPDVIGFTDGGHGNNLSLELDYTKLEKQFETEREISKIFDDGRIVFSNVLVPGLKIGHLNIKKWELYLTVQYSGVSLYSSRYDIIKDFTPYLRLPLSSDSLVTLQLSYNKTIGILDNKIKELEERLNLLRQ